MFGRWALPLCLFAATAGATASFIVSRYFFAERSIGAMIDFLRIARRDDRFHDVDVALRHGK
jgi:uncharacterized membrane protein YdjX (TVP38/TMEM64 family)